MLYNVICNISNRIYFMTMNAKFEVYNKLLGLNKGPTLKLYRIYT